MMTFQFDLTIFEDVKMSQCCSPLSKIDDLPSN